MRSNRVIGLIALASALLFSGCSHYAHETRGARMGVLRCNAVPDTRSNVLITSSVDIECEFQTDQRLDHYRGQTGIQLGVDASYLTRERFWFTVFSGIAAPDAGFLAGRFVGAKASATLGLGIGIGALIGGGDQNITLEPLGLEVSSGVGVAAGISFLNLTSVSAP